MNEVDLAKLLAGKYSKLQVSTEGQDPRELVRDEFRTVYKVWSAFVKFIRSQVVAKERMVDTGYIGHIYNKGEGRCEYLIS